MTVCTGVRRRAGALAGAALAAMAAAVPPSAAIAQAPVFLVDSTFDSQVTTIYSVNPSDGQMTLRADLGTSYTPVFGLAAESATVLWATGTDATTSNLCAGNTACLLLRIVLDPASTIPASVTVIGPVMDGPDLVQGLSGLTFRSDGTLYAASQTTDRIYTIDRTTAQATLIGTCDVPVHGGDLTFDQNDLLWLWTNIGSMAGLYQVDPATGSCTAYDIKPNLTFAGLAAVGHSRVMLGSNPPADRLHEIESQFGPTGNQRILMRGSLPFDHKRGDLDSPFCADDAACDDGNECSADSCTAGGCHRLFDPECCGEDTDGDGVGDLCDRCDTVPDPEQLDRDADGEGDACDADDDGDSIDDAFDCAPLEPMSAALPTEVAGVTVHPFTPTAVIWQQQEPGTRFDVITGSVSPLRDQMGVGNVTCLANNVKGETAGDDRWPGPNQGFFYLVRGQNICGSGDFGRSSSGAPRLPWGECP